MSERGRPGRLVDGRFELLERLGSGGMGTVWRARDVGLHREVAIKEVRPADSALLEHNPVLAAQQRERVLRESRALARLQHPNVVSIYQIIESPDSPYPWIVMELVRGTSLDSRLQSGALTPAESARIGRDVLAALRAAHAAGILHRDVKPGNVLLRPDGGAVLTDFGIAAMHDSTQLTATGEVIGSPEYMAPERLRGDETQTASDLWSLAMLLYVAVEGYHPMRRATTMATLAAVMTEQVPPPRRAGALGPALSAVLVHDPAARPTGEQLDLMLAAAEHGALGPLTPAGPAFPAPHTPAGAFPAQHSGPQAPRYQQPYPAYQPSEPVTRPPTARGRVVAVVASYSVSAVVVIAAIVFLLNSFRGVDDPSKSNTGSHGTVPNVGGRPSTTTRAPAEDLLTPAGARKVVDALKPVMGGSKVSDFTLYVDSASATAPAKGVKNGYDDFVYRDGAATRARPDTVDADRTVLDLDTVNWDALPALWARANKELGVDRPTSRYVVVDTDIIDGTPSMKLYVSDDYGAGYLAADLAGNVTDLYPRG
ncbi:serine/threonine-protein kinase [Actinophytocola sp.]|uniref:serine/threonine-protein kinase n=1 Tax=Actinophytocola sp. TaxID=1872138 RepID=UPI002D5649BF|nr:protein kinase [Actinophytocola sp.]HYQ69210.1 protein kinase [Actinophytocola sp.]